MPRSSLIQEQFKPRELYADPRNALVADAERSHKPLADVVGWLQPIQHGIRSIKLIAKRARLLQHFLCHGAPIRLEKLPAEGLVLRDQPVIFNHVGGIRQLLAHSCVSGAGDGYDASLPILCQCAREAIANSIRRFDFAEGDVYRDDFVDVKLEECADPSDRQAHHLLL